MHQREKEIESQEKNNPSHVPNSQLSLLTEKSKTKCQVCPQEHVKYECFSQV